MLFFFILILNVFVVHAIRIPFQPDSSNPNLQSILLRRERDGFLHGHLPLGTRNTQIHLQDMKVDIKHLENALSAAYLSKASSIDLNNFELIPAAMKMISESLPNTSLLEMNMTKCGLMRLVISNDEAQRFSSVSFDFIEALSHSSIEVLYLSGNPIVEDDLIALFRALPHTKIRTLKLQGSKISKKAYMELFKSIKYSKITHLDMHQSEIDEETFNLFADALVEHGKIKELHLPRLADLSGPMPIHNSPRFLFLFKGDSEHEWDALDKIIDGVCDFLQSVPKVDKKRKFSWQMNNPLQKIATISALEVLDIGYNPLNDVQSEDLATGLTSSNLKTLKLEFTGLSSNALLGIMRALRFKPIEELHLRGNSLHAMDLIIISKAIPLMPSLKVLDISRNIFEILRFQYITREIQKIESIEEIHVVHNIAIGIFVDSLKNSNIETLILDEVALAESFTNCLSNAIPQTKLQNLSFGREYTFLTRNGQTEMGLAVEALQNPNLETLCWESNNVALPEIRSFASFVIQTNLKELDMIEGEIGLGDDLFFEILSSASIRKLRIILKQTTIEENTAVISTLQESQTEEQPSGLRGVNLERLNYLSSYLPSSQIESLHLVLQDTDYADSGLRNLIHFLPLTKIVSLELEFRTGIVDMINDLSLVIHETKLERIHISSDDLSTSIPSKSELLSILFKNIESLVRRYSMDIIFYINEDVEDEEEDDSENEEDDDADA